MIKKLVNNKATGIHGMPNKALKECAENIDPSLTDIFNFSIETGVFPDDLKVGRVAPVYKSGEKDDLNNNRPISMLPTVARVFEKMLYGQVYDYFTSNKLLGNQQFGFRTLHSTALAPRGGGTHDIFRRVCATVKSLYRPFLEFLTKTLDPFRNFCA